MHRYFYLNALNVTLTKRIKEKWKSCTKNNNYLRGFHILETHCTVMTEDEPVSVISTL